MYFPQLSFVFLVFTTIQHVTSLRLNPESVPLHYFSDENLTSLVSEYELRFGISDLWQSIKNAITQLWDFIKGCVSTTVEFINKCVRAMQEKTKDLLQKAEGRLIQLKEELQENLRKWAEKSAEIRDIVATCYQEEKKQIQEIFANSLLGVHQCVDRALGDVSRVEAAALLKAENTSDYMDKLKDSLEDCKNALDVEGCLTQVKYEIEKEGATAEVDHKSYRAETKSLIDNILEEVSKCVALQLLKTTNALANKVVIIGMCVNGNLSTDNQLNIYFDDEV